MKRLFTMLSMVLMVALFVIYPLATEKKADSASGKNKKYEYYYNEKADMGNTSMKESIATTATNPSTAPQEPTPVYPVEMDLQSDSLTVLVNKDNGLPSDYVPSDLSKPNVRFETDNYEEKNYMRTEAAKALEKLFTAAEKDSCILHAVSGYRSYKRQQEIYQNNLYHKGYVATIAVSAEPGYSEHQTGLAMDISTASLSCDLSTRFASTKEGQWVAKHAHQYGYVIRYPEKKSKVTGYTSEPWHIRYVGKKLATFLYQNDITLDEYYGYQPSKKILDQLKDMETLDIDNESKPCDLMTPSPKPKSTPKPSKAPKEKKKGNQKKKTSAVSGSAIQ